MKAFVYTSYGSPDALELREVEKPVPKPNQVLVKIQAASVNPLDWRMLHGKPVVIRLMGMGIFKPKQQILGADIAGRVEAVGAEVTQFKPGDEVFGTTLGGFAEYGCSSEKSLAKKPASMSFEQAAAVPIAGLTALQGLRDIGGLQAGKSVLINGASGGVGTFAVQIAKVLGVEVTGVCSTRNVEMVRSLGADCVIDYTKEDYTKSGKRYDLILDIQAYHSVLRNRCLLTPTGTYVAIGGSLLRMFQTLALGPLLSKKGGQKIAAMMAKIISADLAYLADLFTAGRLTPVIDRSYSFAQIPEAVRYLETLRARGKVVIDVCRTNATSTSR